MSRCTGREDSTRLKQACILKNKCTNEQVYRARGLYTARTGRQILNLKKCTNEQVYLARGLYAARTGLHIINLK
jgi:hypothetical protein